MKTEQSSEQSSGLANSPLEKRLSAETLRWVEAAHLSALDAQATPALKAAAEASLELANLLQVKLKRIEELEAQLIYEVDEKRNADAARRAAKAQLLAARRKLAHLESREHRRRCRRLTGAILVAAGILASPFGFLLGPIDGAYFFFGLCGVVAAALAVYGALGSVRPRD